MNETYGQGKDGQAGKASAAESKAIQETSSRWSPWLMWNKRRYQHKRVRDLIRLRNECVQNWRGIHDAIAVYGEKIGTMAGKVIRG